MTLRYGFLKCKLASDPVLQSKRLRHETQYHLHVKAEVAVSGGSQQWDTAINVGTNDSDDLLRYRLAFDFLHAIRDMLTASAPGFIDLTGRHEPPALDLLRSNVLAETGAWRNSDVLDGSEQAEPIATLRRLLLQARRQSSDVYIFGRTYKTGGPGIHDIHMNQGSAAPFINDGEDDNNDHNDIWQDGAVIVNMSEDEWAAYFTAFTQQRVPTDDLGNPRAGGHGITDLDPGRQR
jgi:uncharacterized protein YukJ